jgi:V/A-type H+-transporting ATPase subunit E
MYLPYLPYSGCGTRENGKLHLLYFTSWEIIMAEDLQHLINKIKTEAVDKAEAEASKILSEAKSKAAQIVKEAEAQAKAKLEKADSDSQAYAERSEKTLQQAARDVVLAVSQGVEKAVLGVLALNVDKTLTPELLQQVLLTLANGYAGKAATVSLSESDAKKLASFVSGEFQKKLGAGVDVQSDNGIFAGFRLSFENGKVSQEWTNAAIADALSAILRPALAKAVQQAIKG